MMVILHQTFLNLCRNKIDSSLDVGKILKLPYDYSLFLLYQEKGKDISLKPFKSLYPQGALSSHI